jgi:uncharacterized protein YjbI with pentapeptide repeats
MRNSSFFGSLLVLLSGLALISTSIAGMVSSDGPRHAAPAQTNQINLFTAAMAAERNRVAQAKARANSSVERIKSGKVDCPHCDLSGADLSNECVKGGDLTGANFSHAKALYMCMSIANFSGASFRFADLTGANLGHSNLKGADMTGAKLNITSIKGADLSTAKGLTQAQLDLACGDAETKLPDGFQAKSCA